MLSPGSPYTPWILGAVAVALVALLVLRAVRKNRTEYRRFKTFTETEDRQRMLRKWLLASFVSFGGASVVILLLAWQFVSLLLAAVDDWTFIRDYKLWFAEARGLGIGLVVGAVVGFLALTALAAFAARKEKDIVAIGDIQAMLPRNRQELFIAGALSVNAGVVEELLLRLAFPALLFGTTGNAVSAVVASVAFFGAMHVYQGVWGVLGATVIGAVLMAIYLVTGSILLPIVVHALIDLRSLVLIPVLVYRVHRVVPAAG